MTKMTIMGATESETNR